MQASVQGTVFAAQRTAAEFSVRPVGTSRLARWQPGETGAPSKRWLPTALDQGYEANRALIRSIGLLIDCRSSERYGTMQLVDDEQAIAGVVSRIVAPGAMAYFGPLVAPLLIN
jgi:hypothetical protein